MGTLGITAEEQAAAWRVLAGIYHLGAAGACKGEGGSCLISLHPSLGPGIRGGRRSGSRCGGVLLARCTLEVLRCDACSGAAAQELFSHASGWVMPCAAPGGAGVGLSCACLQAGRALRGFASCQLSGEAQGWWLLGECLWFVPPAHCVPRGTAKGQLQVAVMLSSLECLMQ